MSKDTELFDEDEAKKVQLVAQAVGAGIALLGLLASDRRMDSWATYVEDAWRGGDLMAMEFMRRAKALAEEGANG